MKHPIVLGLVLSTTVVTPAFAGSDSHGGNTVLCPTKELVTLDYYHAALPTMGAPAELTDIARMSEAVSLKYVEAQLMGTIFAETYRRALRKQGAVDGWIATSLRDVDDSAEPYILPKTCRRITAAIRQDDQMYVDPEVYRTLSEPQKGLLRAHEALYEASGQDSSKNVRNFFRAALKLHPSQAELEKAIRALGGKVHVGEMLSGIHMDPLGRCTLRRDHDPNDQNAIARTFVVRGRTVADTNPPCPLSDQAAQVTCVGSNTSCEVEGGCKLWVNLETENYQHEFHLSCPGNGDETYYSP